MNPKDKFESWEAFDEWFSIAGVHNYVVVEDMLYVNAYRQWDSSQSGKAIRL
ncbi:MAG: hypothetical protein ACUVWR_05285 [Anaerolineae bacterium]